MIAQDRGRLDDAEDWYHKALAIKEDLGNGPGMADSYCLWVPNWSSTSCDLGVFVYQSTEPIASSDARLGRRRRGGIGWSGAAWFSVR
jgi:hypothetical protein